MRYRAALASCILTLLLVVPANAQQSSANSSSLINIHVSQSLPTVNYRSNGSTKVNFVGTALLPRAEGEAKVSAQGSGLRIQAEFKGLGSPTTFGNAYLVYVLWAITPDGRASNLGRLIVKDGKSKMDVTTKVQTFGMMVTAEPYFAVSFPSEKVVLANAVRKNTRGLVSEVDANMGLLQRGTYPDSDFPSFGEMNRKIPLALYQARNAVRIAQFEQAEKYAPDAFAKAEQSLRQAEDYQRRKQKQPAEAVARQAVQSAEDAREIAVKRRDQEQVAREQAAIQAKANAQTEQANAQAQLAQARAAQAQAEAKLQAEQRALAQQQQALAQQQAAAAQAQQQAAEAQAQKARDAAAQAVQQQQQLRAQLLAQFNRVLPTTDTSRGLMVKLGDVLFATAKSDLRPAAKEALARFSGIVLNYPTLKFAIEGYTDSTGSEAFNQALSERRAESVRDYLLQQGLNANAMTATGFGPSNPVASNSTAAGRQQNRRVDIIVSGEVIGTRIGGAN